MVDESVTAWSIESVTPNTEAAARELASKAAQITALVERKVGTSANKAESTRLNFDWMGGDASLADMERLIFGRSAGDSKKPRLRLYAEKENGVWTIFDFDYGSWRETLA